MNKSKSVSLVIIDTDEIVLARRAVERSIQLFPVEEVLIFSDQPSQWGGFPVVEIKKITSMADYNRVLLTELPQRLKTDFALIIQFDGFVVNPSSFTNFFYEFDYIGAPWPAGLIPDRGPLVGNGGFSLRSKKLIQTLANYFPAIMIDVPEDVMICRYLRPILEEREGISFAPVEVARHFSIELETLRGYRPFGFHGLHLLPEIYKDDYKFLIENLPVRCFQDGTYQLQNLKNGFSSLGAEAQQLFFNRSIEVNATVAKGL